MHPYPTLLLLSALLALTAGARAAEPRAEGAYPAKAVRIVLPLSAGGSADAITRMVGEIYAVCRNDEARLFLDAVKEIR